MNRRIRLRTLLMGGFFTLLFAGLLVRVYWVQVVTADVWLEHAKQTWATSEKLLPERGMLTDRSGIVLAADAKAYTIAVGPKRLAELEEKHPEWKLIDRIASKLHNVLGADESEVRADMISRKNDGTYRDQREVRPEGWKVDKEIKDRLEKFRAELRDQLNTNDIGLYFMEDQKRYYPGEQLAAHILGYQDKEGKAVYGLEKKLDDVLRGEEGYVRYEKDGGRTQLPNGEFEIKQAVDGSNVTLTIDRDIQFYIEEALRNAYETYKPISATAIAADPNTMEILGMASMPDYNPNEYWLTGNDQKAYWNHAIQSVYEPGSTFKIMTLAAAVEEGEFHPDELYKSGYIKYDKIREIRDHNWSGWGEITYLEGLKHSSNVAFVKLGYEMLGKDKFVDYIDAFGFGVKTGIDLPNEVSLPYSLDNPTEVTRATFGQGKVLVTPIQQVAAVAAVANGGKLMKPYIVKSITDPQTGETVVNEPQVVRQVISPESSRLVNGYLEQVVSDQEIGTGRRAYIPGYKIAGKTGTAQKVINKQYSADKYVVSFIGYAPADDPKIVLYVLVDEPQVDDAGGGAIAAPIFREIMEKSLNKLNILPDLPPEEEDRSDEASHEPSAAPEVTAEVPNVTGMTAAAAKQKLQEAGFPFGQLGAGPKVLQQLPKAGSVIPGKQQVYLLTEKKQGGVPSLKGFSLRDSLEMCALLEVVCTAEGEGYVVDQQAIKKGDVWTLHVRLEPANRADFGDGGDGTSEAASGGPQDDEAADDEAPDGEAQAGGAARAEGLF